MAGKLKILIFSGSEKSGRGLQMIVKKLGFPEPVLALDPKLAVKAVLAGTCNLVLLDWPTGSKSAFLVYRALRESPAHRAFPVLIMAEPSDRQTAAIAAKDPAAEALAKPFSGKDFMAKITSLAKNAPAKGAKATKGAPPGQESGGGHPRTFSGACEYLKEKNGPKARKIFEHLLKETGPSSRLYLGLAMAYQQIGEEAKSRASLMRAVEAAEKEVAAPAAQAAQVSRDKAPKAEAAPEPAAPEGPTEHVRGIWSALPVKEKRQKAFENFTPQHEKRSSFRLFVPDWSVAFHSKGGRLQAVDLSFTGVGFEAPRPLPERGETVYLDLYQGEEPALENVKATVRRVEELTVGVSFDELDREQEKVLNAKLREEQKKGAQLAQEFDGADEKAAQKKVIKLSF